MIIAGYNFIDYSNFSVANFTAIVVGKLYWKCAHYSNVINLKYSAEL